MWFDTHCHLDAGEFDSDREAMLERAGAAGVDACLVPAVHVGNFAAVLAMADGRRGPRCYPALGLHPVWLASHQDQHLAELRAELTLHRARVVAVGEIGLDGFVPGLEPARQEALFVAQLRIAADLDLPVVLHVRHAQDQVLKQLRRIRVRGGIAHAFNGSRQQAEAFLQLGFKLGFGGAMTYPRALRIRDLAAWLPDEALVLETDAPDIPPVFAAGFVQALGGAAAQPSGRPRNEPACLPQIAAVLAELRGCDLVGLADLTRRNAQQVFGLAP